MPVTKRKMTMLALLAMLMAGVETTVFSSPALASDQDRAGADLPPLTHVIDDVSRLPTEAARLHAYVSTPLFPQELAYRQIPWLVNLNEAVRLARQEKRPLLLWTSGDDPLDRC